MKNKFLLRVFFVIFALGVSNSHPETNLLPYRTETAIAATTIADLEAAITSAQALHDGAVEGTAPGNYPALSKATLQSVINSAKTSRNYYYSSDDNSVLSPAITSLANAVDVFKSKVIASDGADTDGDGILDTADNCATVSNASQSDADGDGKGDACDSTDDRDTAPPTITLLGPVLVDITVGTAYIDAYGATADDDTDGDITENITLDDSAIDKNVIGSYTVTYSVSDAAGNAAANVSRTVRVVAVSENDDTDDSSSAPPSTASSGGGGILVISRFAPADASIEINSGNEKTANRNVALALKAEGATMMAISNDADFTESEWETFSASKEWVLTEGNGGKTVYVRFRNSKGKASAIHTDSIILEKKTGERGEVLGDDTVNVRDGDLVQCKSCQDPFAVYVVKVSENKKFIRHIKPSFFRYYRHATWSQIIQVNTLDKFIVSSLVRVNTGASGQPLPTDRVYEINADGSKHWLNMDSAQFHARGGTAEAIYTVNRRELGSYFTGADVLP